MQLIKTDSNDQNEHDVKLQSPQNIVNCFLIETQNGLEQNLKPVQFLSRYSELEWLKTIDWILGEDNRWHPNAIVWLIGVELWSLPVVWFFVHL